MLPNLFRDPIGEEQYKTNATRYDQDEYMKRIFQRLIGLTLMLLLIGLLITLYIFDKSINYQRLKKHF